MIFRWPRPLWTAPDIESRNDPLSHPEIRAMGPDELADIPFSSMREHKSC